VSSPTASGIFGRILLSIFVLCLIAGAGGFYALLHYRALQSAAGNARLLLTTAVAIRSYTSEQVLPNLEKLPGDRFYEETIPSFAAQSIYRRVQASYPAYTYREPALNPTNPSDRPTAFEVELINRFRADPGLTELKGTREDAQGSVFYFARPIKITQPACLSCHSTPDRAPAAMLAKYGSANGFGWNLNETVGIQTLTVPVAEELRGAVELTMSLAGGLLLVFLVTYCAVRFSLNVVLVRPLLTLARAAEVASRTADERVSLPRSGAHEIRSLSDSIERLRISLFKALNELTNRPQR
jgi:HAMP domain-containing protein